MTTGTAARDLLVCAAPPEPGSRIATIARALSEHGGVDLVHVGEAGGAIDGVTLHPVRPVRGPRRRIAYTRARALGVPAAFAREAVPELAAAAAKLAAVPGRRRVIGDGPVAGAALLALGRRRPVIYLADRVGLAAAARSTLSAPERLELRSFERGLLGGSAEAWVVRPADAERATEIAGGARVRIIPDALDVEAIAPATERGTAALLAGDFTTAPGQVGLRFVVEEVMPAIWPGHPDVRLIVAGAGAEELEPADERIVVATDGDAYADAGCLLLPALEGRPDPRRFVAALARALPIVATPRAVRGIHAAPGIHYLEAFPSRVDFAIAVVEALKGESGPRIAAAGRRLAQAEHSLQALAERLAPDAPL